MVLVGVSPAVAACFVGDVVDIAGEGYAYAEDDGAGDELWEEVLVRRREGGEVAGGTWRTRVM